MSDLFDKLVPISQFLSRIFNGPYFYQITRVRGGNSQGTDWISKYYNSYYTTINRHWQSLQDRFRDAKLSHLWEDNWCRVLLLNGVERLISMRQGHAVLPSKLFVPTFSFEGGFKGWFKGGVLSSLHFSGVLYPALYFSGGSYFKFSLFYLLFDLVMMPLDRLRTISYNTLGCAKDIVFNSQAYSGALQKLAFNIPFLWALKTTVSESSGVQKVLAWGSVALAYPLLSLKTQYQLNDQSIRSPFLPKLYAGLLPFLALNILGHWTLKHVYSDQTKNRLRQDMVQQSNKYNRGLIYGASN